MSNWKKQKFNNETGELIVPKSTVKKDQPMVELSNITKETEKAVYNETKLDLIDVGKTVKFGFWTPKSLIKDGKIPLWFLNSKIEEFLKYINYNSRNCSLING